MFCPQCGSTQDDELRFCKTCGANLQALRQVMATRETEDAFDWGNTWLADMFMSSETAVRQQAKLERIQGLTPEMKRRTEIKAGVITASVGLGVMILLFVLMNGIIATGRVSDAAIEILSRIWVVGVIPLLVGGALIFNGMVVSKRDDGSQLSAGTAPDTKELEMPNDARYLTPADTNDLVSNTPFSVTERTTRHLGQKVPREGK